jgi:hypothetical protein
MRGENGEGLIVMANWADHPNPCLGNPPDGLIMTVDLAPFELPERFERLVIVPSPKGNYVVACLPFFSYGIQFGDLVRLQQPGNRFDCVLESSNLRTIRIAFNHEKDVDSVHEELHGRIVTAGLPHEWYGSGYVAVLLRDVQDENRVLSLVDDLVGSGIVCWEVDPEPFGSYQGGPTSGA